MNFLLIFKGHLEIQTPGWPGPEFMEAEHSHFLVQQLRNILDLQSCYLEWHPDHPLTSRRLRKGLEVATRGTSDADFQDPC
jgi:hypothetical protein